MKVSCSTDLVMQFASYEAISGKFREIEPEHLLMAILKLAELPIKEAEKLAFGERAVKQLQDEIEAVRAELARCSVESTPSRRKLRATLGEGNSKYSGGTMHRSASSMVVFDGAARLADKAGNELVTARDLLEVLMSSPTTSIQQVLCQAIRSRFQKTSTFDELANELAGPNGKSSSEESISHVAESNALVEVLTAENKRSILLISGDKQVTEAVVRTAAREVSQGRATKATAKRIFDVSKIKPCGKWDAETEKLMARVFSEAGSASNVILVVPPIDSSTHAEAELKWAVYLKEAVKRHLVQFICRVEPSVYEQLISQDVTWRRLTKAIWVRDTVDKGIPSRL